MNKYWIHSCTGQKCEVYKEGDPVKLSWKDNPKTYFEVSDDMLKEYYIPITEAEYNNPITLKEIKESRTNNEAKELLEKSWKDIPVNPLEVGGNHYQQPIQPWDYIYSNHLGFDEGNVIKYISRHKQKNGAEDIKKAISYCKHILETQYGGKD